MQKKFPPLSPLALQVFKSTLGVGAEEQTNRSLPGNFGCVLRATCEITEVTGAWGLALTMANNATTPMRPPPHPHATLSALGGERAL